MNLFGVMEVSGSAMKAERIRAEVVAANMANSETTRTVDGGPYRRQHVVFAEAQSRAFASQFSDQTGRTLNTVWMNVGGSSQTVPGGVDVTAIVSDPASTQRRFDPQHPDADKDGYVLYPDINPLTEMVDLMGATRAYGLNSSAVQAAKGMITASLEILK